MFVDIAEISLEAFLDTVWWQVWQCLNKGGV